ncbi:MAG: hypothetical protein O9346_01990 [Leptospiraceae bacterium]|jgi:hypothetical protein|nr:hypothetical protein [Leptospiraceae bacterium]
MTHSNKILFLVTFTLSYFMHAFEQIVQKIWFKAVEIVSPKSALGVVYVPNLVAIKSWFRILFAIICILVAFYASISIDNFANNVNITLPTFSLGLVSIAGVRGNSYWGSGDLMAGASNLYDDCAIRPSLPWTATTTGSSTTLTFSGVSAGSIADHLKVNQYIEIGDTPLAAGNKYAMVLAINETTDSVTLDKAVNVSAASEVRVFARMKLGGYDDFKISFGISKIELKDVLAAGESPANMVVNGGYCNIAIGLARNSLQRQSRVTQGFFVQSDNSGNPDAFAWGAPIGELDSQIERELMAVRVSGGTELAEPQFMIRFFRATPKVESENSYNNNQIFYQTMYTIYPSDNHVYKKTKLFYASSNFVFDAPEASEEII